MKRTLSEEEEKIMISSQKRQQTELECLKFQKEYKELELEALDFESHKQKLELINKTIQLEKELELEKDLILRKYYDNKIRKNELSIKKGFEHNTYALKKQYRAIINDIDNNIKETEFILNDINDKLQNGVEEITEKPQKEDK